MLPSGKTPQAVVTELRRRVEVEQRPVSEFARDIRQNPEAFGPLNGSRSFFGREDAARRSARRRNAP